MSAPPLSAIHVNHGLQAPSHAWVRHCEALCLELNVPLETAYVTVSREGSLEASAREARYDAFAQRLGGGDVLMLAHHREDQAETFLFRLFRGAGVRGLSAMPVSRALGDGHLLRPLLDVGREELQQMAQSAHLSWVDDPSNDDLSLSRNFLRHEVLPAAVARWPKATISVSRASRHLAEAQTLLDELAREDITRADRPSTWPWLSIPSLAFQPLADLSPVRQRNALRCWLRGFGEQPDTEHWDGWRALRDAQADAKPVWALKHGGLLRSMGRVWWLADAWGRFEHAAGQYAWPSEAPTLSLPGNGHLNRAGRVLEGDLQVRYRQGGERLEVPGRGRRDLKRLLNESLLPTFVRSRLPLIYRGDQLIAVANLPGLSSLEAQGVQFQWAPPTSDTGLS